MNGSSWRGKILFHTNFSFKNGEFGKKLIIVLNEPRTTNEPYLVFRVTSNSEGKPNSFGCHARYSLFFLPAGLDFFHHDTWIQLHEVFSFEASDFLDDHFQGKLKVLGQLKESTIKQLLDCIKKITDIDEDYKTLILKK